MRNTFCGFSWTDRMDLGGDQNVRDCYELSHRSNQWDALG
jgi:hypothetical protein